MPLVLVETGCAGTGAADGRELEVNGPEPGPVVQQGGAAPEHSELIDVSGMFMRTFGDPPAGVQGGARIVYTLTTSNREEWILEFDRDRYWPEQGVRGFHRQQVRVNGRLLPGGTLLVESIRLD